MHKKITRRTFCSMLLALPVAARAQQTKKIPRIGFVSGIGDPSNPGPNVAGFRQGLRDFGYIEGKNIVVEYRFAEGRGSLIALIPAFSLREKG